MRGQEAMWAAFAAAIALALIAGIGDWRRNRLSRFDMASVGWMPWRGIQVAALFAALAFAILALH